MSKRNENRALHFSLQIERDFHKDAHEFLSRNRFFYEREIFDSCKTKKCVHNNRSYTRKIFNKRTEREISIVSERFLKCGNALSSLCRLMGCGNVIDPNSGKYLFAIKIFGKLERF